MAAGTLEPSSDKPPGRGINLTGPLGLLRVGRRLTYHSGTGMIVFAGQSIIIVTRLFQEARPRPLKAMVWPSGGIGWTTARGSSQCAVVPFLASLTSGGYNCTFSASCFDT